MPEQTKMERLLAANLITQSQALDPVVIKVVALLSDEEVDNLICLALKVKQFAFPDDCPPPLMCNDSTARKTEAKGSGKKGKNRKK